MEAIMQQELREQALMDLMLRMKEVEEALLRMTSVVDMAENFSFRLSNLERAIVDQKSNDMNINLNATLKVIDGSLEHAKKD
jgi:hypothetical protein